VGIKPLVKEWAYQPDAGLTLVPNKDKRAAVSAPQSTNERFATALRKMQEEE